MNELSRYFRQSDDPYEIRKMAAKELYGNGATFEHGYKCITGSDREPTTQEMIQIIKAPNLFGLGLTREDFEELNKIYEEAFLNNEYGKILKEAYNQNIFFPANYIISHILITEVSLLFIDPLLFVEWVSKIPEVFHSKYDKNILFKMAESGLQLKANILEENPNTTVLNGIIFITDGNRIIPRIVTYELL